MVQESETKIIDVASGPSQDELCGIDAGRVGEILGRAMTCLLAEKYPADQARLETEAGVGALGFLMRAFRRC